MTKNEDDVIARGTKTAIYFLREVCALVRDFGMPIVTFAFGLYVLYTATTSGIPSDPFRLGVGVFLTCLGIGTQLWLYAREHPRATSDEVTHQLSRMTHLVEQYANANLTEALPAHLKPIKGPSDV